MTQQSWGLAAIGAQGQVTLELDESIGKLVIYELTITLPTVQLRLIVQNRDIASALSRFLGERYGRQEFAELHLGTLGGLAMRIIKDNEFADRFYLRAAGEGMIGVSIIDPQASDLNSAARQLAADAAEK